MLLANIKVYKEGVSVGIASKDGKTWGDYYLTGEKAAAVTECLGLIMSENEPVIGSMPEKKKRRKGKK